jgi:hypothetical protein
MVKKIMMAIISIRGPNETSIMLEMRISRPRFSPPPRGTKYRDPFGANTQAGAVPTTPESAGTGMMGIDLHLAST